MWRQVKGLVMRIIAKLAIPAVIEVGMLHCFRTDESRQDEGGISPVCRPTRLLDGFAKISKDFKLMLRIESDLVQERLYSRSAST